MAKVIVVVLPIIIISLIVIALIIYAVYSSIYKKKINKKLEQNESTAHVSMVPVQTIGIIMLVIGVIVFAVSTLTMMSNLTNVSSQTNELQQRLRADVNDMSEQIGELKEQLKQQDSLFITFDYNYGEVNSENDTVEVEFACIPKMSGEDTVVSIIAGEDKLELIKDKDGVFKGKKSIWLLNSSIIAQVTTNGITNTQDITGENGEPFFKTVLPVINAKIGGLQYTTNDERTEVTIEAAYFVMHPEGLNDYKLTTYLNGEVVETMAMTSEEHVEKTFDAKDGDKIELVAEGIDKYGYTHRHKAFQTVGDHWFSTDTYLLLKGDEVVFGIDIE